MSDISELIKPLLDEVGVSCKSNSKSYILTCPRCRKKDKLWIFKETGRFVCFYCKEIDNFQGRFEYLLADLSGNDIDWARKKLKLNNTYKPTVYLDLQLKDFYSDGDEAPDFHPEELFEVSWPLDALPLDHPGAMAGRQYLEGRGIPLEIAKLYNIRFQTSKNRVLFPVESRGKLYGWQGRYIKSQTEYETKDGEIRSIPKAVTSKDLKKDKILMFSDRINDKHCVLCEGPVDAIKAHLIGGNVASLGKAVSQAQLNLIRNSGVQRIYLALDPDAYKEAERIIKQMGDLELYDMRPPSKYKDLGEMSFQEVKDLFDSAPRIDGTTLFLYLKNHYA
jgi:DNA primase